MKDFLNFKKKEIGIFFLKTKGRVVRLVVESRFGNFFLNLKKRYFPDKDDKKPKSKDEGGK